MVAVRSVSALAGGPTIPARCDRDSFGSPRRSGVLVVRMAPEIERAMRRARRYVELRERLIEVNPEIRGGEPVIVGTCIPIRGLARQIELGETIEVLREDYPFLREEAFELAPLWAKANPRRGRPPRPWASSERTSAEPARAVTPSL